MVELAPVVVAEAVPFAFCAGLGMTAPTDSDVIDHVVARLRDKQVLVVVDNCEHLLAAAADAVEGIVGACPQVVVLVTSREPLMIRGERLVPVPSLLPQDAERLFLERARDEAPDLLIDADQARAVTELCERLDGLPLALALAASRVRAPSPVELVANLEERDSWSTASSHCFHQSCSIPNRAPLGPASAHPARGRQLGRRGRSPSVITWRLVWPPSRNSAPVRERAVDGIG
jgi:predicted ATPase